MSRAGPINRAGSVRRDDFHPGIKWAQFAEMNFQPGLSTNWIKAGMILITFSGNLVVIFLHLCSWMGYFTSTSYLQGGTLIFSSDIVLGWEI